MATKKRCFVAYPSTPAALRETIEEAIKTLQKGQVVDIVGWKSTSTSGKFVMTEICKAIDEREIFICDLTDLNHNVLFELGYAIARNKRTWVILDLSIEQSSVDYKKFKLLTTIGYAPYQNSHEIVDAFYADHPYQDTENTLFKTAIESVIGDRGRLVLLYLKSGIETEASIKLSRLISGLTIPSIVDDPGEEHVQTLSWYASQAYKSCAVVVHFLSKQHIGSRLHNAKNSFVSGLSYGFGKPLLMLAHEPYDSPIDYRDLLGTHRTAAQCESIAVSWLKAVEEDCKRRAKEGQKYAEQIAAQTDLQRLSVGDSVAEMEIENLSDYFVPTATYKEAREAEHSIIIGRKGSGKTAILYKLAGEFRSNPENHVCIIKPVAYELEGILQMLTQTLPKAEKGYLIESFWKFLIYTELARSVRDRIAAMPIYYQQSSDEKELCRFVSDNASIIDQEFSIRLESIVRKLQGINTAESAETQRSRISELLHSNVISRLRSVLGRVLEKKRKVVILVDNLDKAWNKREDLPTLCNLLFGLLEVSRRIAVDFEKSDHWRKAVNLSLLIFLRSDIFTQIVRFIPERDKIHYSRIAWDDPEVLLSVVEQRLLHSSGVASPDQIYSRYFCPAVQGVETKRYLTKFILPRPRDLIYLCKLALVHAVNRHHLRIEEQDVLDAQYQYSQYALNSLEAENGMRMQVLESLLYEFAGASEIAQTSDILKAIENCGIPSDKLDEVIQLLCDLTFLGREIEIGRFEYLYDEEDRGKYQVMSRKTAELRGTGEERFRINDAFHSYLEVVKLK